MNIVVLTGAGISAESGLPTFRGPGGLWNGHSATALATPEAFHRDPGLVHDFYNFRRRMLNSGAIAPNPAHTALAELEKASDTRSSFTLLTQNVDNLHERAGSQNVVHIHGELNKARCMDSGTVIDWTVDLSTETVSPFNAGRPGRLRPHIVWFGEVPLHLNLAERAISGCDLFLAIGTSGVVWPAAGMVQWAPAHCRTVLVNLEPPANQQLFSEFLPGTAVEIVPDFCQRLLAVAEKG